MTVEARPITDKEEWLAWRREFVTASQIGGLPAFNCHPYYTPLRIYAGIMGVEFDNSDNPVMRRGRWLEPAVAKAVSELRPEWTLIPNTRFYCDSSIGMGATPDYFIASGPQRGVLQIKTVAPSVWNRDWAKGEDIPLWVTLQTLTEMILTESSFGAVAAMLVDPHAMDVKILDVPRHPEAEKKLVNEVRRFMVDTRAGREPSPDFQRDGAVLKLLLPKEAPGTQLDLAGHNELPKMLELRANLMAQMKRDKKRCEAIENRLKFIMGDNSMVTGLPEWGITFKTQHRKGYTVQPSEPRVLLIRDKRPEDERPMFSDEDENGEIDG